MHKNKIASYSAVGVISIRYIYFIVYTRTYVLCIVYFYNICKEEKSQSTFIILSTGPMFHFL